MRLQGEVAIVTGSTKGIGFGIARRFAAEGAKVLITGRTESAGKDAEQRIRDEGGEALYLRTDVAREDDVAAAVAAAVDTFGKLTVLVNNAAPTEQISGPDRIDGTVEEITAENWNTIVTQVLTSQFLCCKYAIPALAKAGGGSIVNIGSTAAVDGFGAIAAYSAAKAALLGLTRSVAVENADRGIRANCLIVGAVPMPDRDDDLKGVREALVGDNPYGDALRALQLTRLGKAEDIASFALFLASRESEFITGAILMAEGGATAKAPLPQMTPEMFADPANA